jgi:shikimate dehydrogenase
MGFRGGNFTLPHKVAVVPLLDGLTESAELMGAVNCVFWQDDQLMGDNTDGKGFLCSLKEVTEPSDKKVVVFGAGGAARAITVELGLSGVAEIVVVNRSAERGQELADLLHERVKVSTQFVSWEGDYVVEEDTDILINATSIGMGDGNARLAVAEDSLRKSMVVADVIVNPAETRLLREAEERGCTTLHGLGMLVQQGVLGFRRWTAVDPDVDVMREALEEYLEL